MASMDPQRPRQSHSKLGPTAFPKINGRKDVFLRGLKRLKAEQGLEGEVTMEGTVKLHGMHSDIVFELTPEDKGRREGNNQGRVLFQSRNREVIAAESRLGWPGHVAYYLEELHRLKHQILVRFQRKNPHQIIDIGFPLVIGGEWIGHKVQLKVGISQLTPRFVILSVNINGAWQNDNDYRDIESPDANVYTIFRCPVYRVSFNLRDLTEGNPAFDQMQQLADQVEACCPYAESFGIQQSRGEGIVWKIGTLTGRAEANKWFKTKGPISSGLVEDTTVDEPKPVNISKSRARSSALTTKFNRKISLNPADYLAAKFVTAHRLEQAFEYLDEMQIDKTAVENWQTFSEWLIDDIFDEEKPELESLKEQYNTVPGFNLEVQLRKNITRQGQSQYLNAIERRKGTALQNGPTADTNNECYLLAERKMAKGIIDNNSVELKANPATLSDDFDQWMAAFESNKAKRCGFAHESPDCQE